MGAQGQGMRMEGAGMRTAAAQQAGQMGAQGSAMRMEGAGMRMQGAETAGQMGAQGQGMRMEGAGMRMQGAEAAGNLGLQSSQLGLSGISAGLGAQQQAAGIGQGIAGLGQQQLGFGQAAQALANQDVSTLMQTGGMQQAHRQAILDTNRMNEYSQMMVPYQQLAFASDIITGAPSGVTSTMMQPGPNPVLQGLGLGLAGYGLLRGLQ